MGRLNGCNDRAMTATLVAKNLAGGFAHRTLFEGLDLTVGPGDVVGVVGVNGAGKAHCCGSWPAMSNHSTARSASHRPMRSSGGFPKSISG